MSLTVIRNYCKSVKRVPVVLVHGGAGKVPEDSYVKHKNGVKLAARKGYEELIKTGSAFDAVHQAVVALEQNPLFNAGFGSALTYDGNVEMDASIMNGADLNAGCVSLIKNINSPVTLARKVMEKTRHKYLAGEGAMCFAIEQCFEMLPEGALVTPSALENLNKFKKKEAERKKLKENCENPIAPGTVGAVAIDTCGNLAAATSTGGVNGKMSGRIGDSSLLGAGNYADNEVGAVSVTGLGETIMRYNVASKILALIQFQHLTAQEASEFVIVNMEKRLRHKAGVITIDRCGGLGIYFSTPEMAWAYHNDISLCCGIVKDEFESEEVT
ncbi:isoaspartyl peptidase/L-asparaginase-like [Teleopsis dalmanni]|uniref:isoaspartyl peptidase/L-asparaginase-like n=1 Tax=Teleopsis dalmanni TaxID=139649 RepID=UPI0018CC9357|nr:isoaspartyl peptidase/L-asparaginase-like [Teleopsis dalmanni]XP_037932204.1 isoaspartyl peptidase/L-asparaginase-like [Teleopsis dalmanni]